MTRPISSFRQFRCNVPAPKPDARPTAVRAAASRTATTMSQAALRWSSVVLAGALGGLGCHKDSPTAPAPSETAGGTASATPIGAPAAQARAKRGLPFKVEGQGLVTYLIDAPVEKGKGKWTKLRGEVFVEPTDLAATSGHVDVDLDDLVTYTFDDPSKNRAQTTHAHNWLEIGTEVPAETKDKNRWAVLTIQSIQGLSNGRLADAPEKSSAPGDPQSQPTRTVTLTAGGDFVLHGVHVAKTLKLAATFGGSATAPASISIKTVEPFDVSLSQHDVKPRDVVGKFLSGALDVVVQNKKIVDTAHVSIEDLKLVSGN